LRGRRVKSIISPEEETELRPFDSPAKAITIDATAAGFKTTLEVGKMYGGGVCVRLSGEDRIVVTDSTLLGVFEKTVFDLRDRRLLKFKNSAAKKIVFNAFDYQITLVRPGREWVLPNPALGEIDQQDAGRLVVILQNLRFTGVADEEPRGEPLPYRLSNPDITLTIFDESGTELDRLACVKNRDDPNLYYATSRSSELIAELEAAMISGLIDDFRSLREP
jgi:hypothetical protein